MMTIGPLKGAASATDEGGAMTVRRQPLLTRPLQPLLPRQDAAAVRAPGEEDDRPVIHGARASLADAEAVDTELAEPEG